MARPANLQARRQGALKKDTTFRKQLWFGLLQMWPPVAAKHLALTNGYIYGPYEPLATGPLRINAGIANKETPCTKTLKFAGVIAVASHCGSNKTKLRKIAERQAQDMVHVDFLSLSSWRRTSSCRRVMLAIYAPSSAGCSCFGASLT